MNRFLRPQANPQNDSFAPTYNLGWKNHLNFIYKNQNQVLNPPLGFQAPQPPQAPQEKKSDLEDLIMSYITSNE